MKLLSQLHLTVLAQILPYENSLIPISSKAVPGFNKTVALVVLVKLSYKKTLMQSIKYAAKIVLM